MHKNLFKILIVDDDPIICESLKEIFSEIGNYYADVAFDPFQGLEKLQAEAFDIVLSDILMPKMDGIEFLKNIKARDPALPVVMITGFPTVDIAIKAMKEGASDFITKPFRYNQIKIIAEKLIRERKLLLENVQLHDQLKQKKTIETLNKNLNSKIQEISILYTISESFSAPHIDEDIYSVYARITEMAAEITGSSFALLMVIDREHNQLIPSASFGLNGYRVSRTIDLGNVRGLDVLQKQEPFLIHNGMNAMHEVLGISEQEFNCNSLATLPLLIKGEMFGLLIVGNTHTMQSFNQNDMMLLQNLSRKASLNIENRLLYDSIIENMRDTLHSLVTAIEARDKYTLKHSIRVTDYSIGIAKVIGCTDDEIEILNSAGQLHDIGKIGISDDILLKRGNLTANEYNIIKQHPVIGENILQPLGFLPMERDIIRNHHERWDGGGYPDGLQGESIPLLSRIIAVADSYDAMTTDRPYRSALTPDAALRELVDNKLQFDNRVVDAFIESLEEYSQGSNKN